MKIAVIAPPWLPVPPVDYGGTELVVDILCRGYQRAGHEVTLFCSGESTCPVERRSAVSKGSMPPDKHQEHLHLGYVLGELLKGGYDVIHSHLEGFLPYVPLTGIPALTTVHVPVTESRRRLLDKGFSQLAAISLDQAGDFPTQTKVIHHGIEFERYRLAKRKENYLLWLGSLSPEKGVERSVEIARSAELKLVLAGPARPETGAWLRSLASDHSFVEMRGPVSFAEKVELLGKARALLMPVKWREPFGLVALEAMACGTPVIASPMGALAEIVEHGMNGYLCEGNGGFARAVRRCPELEPEEIRSAAASRFSAQKMIDEYLSFLSDLSFHPPSI